MNKHKLKPVAKQGLVLIVMIIVGLLFIICAAIDIPKILKPTTPTVLDTEEKTNTNNTKIYIIYDNPHSQTKRVVFYPPQQLEEPVETTLYDTFTDEEIHLIECTVQHEVGAFSDTYKRFIAELIYNRLISNDFPDDISQVLYQENQFCGIHYWYSPDFEVDDSTKAIVKEVFSQDKTSHDATYYYNPDLSDYQSTIWFEYSGDVEYCFEYTEEDWGIEYTTRFFK